MAQLDASMTLAQVVDAHPDLARALERVGLDYCCGGGRTLGEACNEAGLDTADVVRSLEASATTGGAAEWTTMPADVLVDHLEATHHRFLWDELPRVTSLLDRIVAVHGDRHPELARIATCFARIRTDLEPHMRKEEQVLFPMIRELVGSATAPVFSCGTLRNPISVMMREHDAVGELLAELRVLTGGFSVPADGCASYTACFAAMAEIEADTHLHVHKENNVLFPLVVRLEDERGAPVPA